MPKIRLFALIALLGLNACTAMLPAPAEAPRLYLLEAAVPTVERAASGSAILQLHDVSANPGYDTAGMAYVTRPHELAYYRDSQWADTPARMLQALLLDVLNAQGCFKVVAGTQVALLADYRLDVDIVRLQQEFLHQPSQVALELRAEMVRQQSGSAPVSRSVQITEPADSEDAYGGVLAANRAVGKALNGIARWACAQVQQP